MCLAIPGKIKSINGFFAVVDIMGIEKNVNIQLLECLKVEDYILIHAGFGIQKIDLKYFDYLQDIYDKELQNEEII